MSLDLLDRTRKINQLIFNEGSDKLDFGTISKILAETMNSNVVIFSKRGKVLGETTRPDIPPIPKLSGLKRGKFVEKIIAQRMAAVLSTHENISLECLGMDFENCEDYNAMISPIIMSKEFYGSVFVYNNSYSYSINDIILLEHSIVTIGLAMLISMGEEEMLLNRQSDNVNVALQTLSTLELKAVYNILKELGGNREGKIVTSKLSKAIGITRSVVINSLKKCESAGIIKSQSLGMKGTSIKITNDLLNAELIERFIDGGAK